MRIVLLAFGLWAGLGVAGAHAQQASADDDTRARAHFRTGQKLSDQGKFEAAFAEFSAGHTLSKRPAFLFNMAECARQSGKLVRARALYEKYMRADPHGKLVRRAARRIAEIDRRRTRSKSRAAARPRPIPLTVTINTIITSPFDGDVMARVREIVAPTLISLADCHQVLWVADQEFVATNWELWIGDGGSVASIVAREATWVPGPRHEQPPEQVVACVAGILDKLTFWTPDDAEPLVLGFRASPRS